MLHPGLQANEFLQRLAFTPVLIGVLASACSQRANIGNDFAPTDTVQVRRELERLYAANTEGFVKGDLQALMDLRAADFHTVAADGSTRDRAAMKLYMEGIINGIKKWNQLSFTIDSLRVERDTAYAIVSQYLDRMALRPDNQVHHVQTWVTQREIWIRSGRRWLMWSVDQLRNQRRVIDGQPG